MTDPIRVSHLIAPVAFGGGEALLADLLGTHRDDLEESVVTVGWAPLLETALTDRGIRSQALGRAEVGNERAGRVGELRSSLGLVRPLRKLLSDQRPDVVHAHGFPPSLLAQLAVSPGTRTVYMHHYERRPPGAIETRVLTRLFGRYEALTTPADHLTAAMNKHFPALPRPFTTLRLGLDERFYDGRPQAHWRGLFPPGTSIGICVGRLVATKNQGLIVRSLASLSPADRRGIGVVIVGDGPDGGALRAMVDAEKLADHVQFAGVVPRDQMPDLLASVDFGVFPTVTEASSVATAEALASGLPVLALDIPSMRESVGPAGILTDEDSFAPDLVRLAHAHATLRPAARARAEGSRVSTVRATWAALYHQVTARPAVVALESGAGQS